jgi:chorismate mutase/prephenate dehydratase
MDLGSWRAEIDEIDDQILDLLNRRARISLEIARLETSPGGGVLDAGREREILARACLANDGPLDSRAIRNIFRRLLAESRRLAAKVGARELMLR